MNNIHTLLIPLDTQPQVVTFTLDSLLQRGFPIEEVIVIHPETTSAWLQNSLARLNAEFIGDHYQISGCSIHFRSYIPQFDGILLEERKVDQVSMNIAEASIYHLINDLKKHQRLIHMVVGIGKPSFLSLFALSTYVNLGLHDQIWYVYLSDVIAEKSKDGALMHLEAKETGFNLLKFPVVSSIGTYNYGLTSSLDGAENGQELHIRIVEDPLTMQNLTTIISALTELHTKCWLLQEGRIADLTEYSQKGNPQFDKEAALIITKLTHNSPTWFDLISYVLSASGGIAVMKLLIDAVIQAPLRYKEKEADVVNKRTVYLINEIGKVLEIVEKYSDSETKAEVVRNFLPTLTELGKGKGLERPLLAAKNETTKTIESK
ncbi:MAG TPA: CRISPR-associated ring nuclease [Methylomirabilota bacterium]|nr:CRISPR-associated ring nuclease [Methylomirabilota bacterium]